MIVIELVIVIVIVLVEVTVGLLVVVVVVAAVVVLVPFLELGVRDADDLSLWLLVYCRLLRGCGAIPRIHELDSPDS